MSESSSSKRAQPSPTPFDYDDAARTYDDFRHSGGPFLEPILRLAEDTAPQDVLELGCGTANNTSAFFESCPVSIAALDRSPGMIRKAKAKSIRARWVVADAHHIPFAAEAFDFAFGVLVLHHLADLERVFRECYRVLRTGYAAFATAPHSFIEAHPMNEYFPSFAAIDKGRFQPVEEVREALSRSGFTETGVEYTTAAPQRIDSEYVKKIEGKFISTYALIPEDEFDRGLSRLRADVAERGRLDAALAWESAVVWGKK